MMQKTQKRPLPEQQAQHLYGNGSQYQKRRFAGPEPDDSYIDDAIYDTRIPNSARRYAPAPNRTEIRVTHHEPAVRRTSAQPQTRTQEPQTRPQEHQSTQRPRAHPLIYVGVGMLLFLVLWTIGSMAISWVQSKIIDLTYGHPRTYQTDARVGHNDTQTPSHFIAINLNDGVVVIEIPGGDTTKAIAYVGPTLATGHNLDPVTLEFRDVNGDGKPDMIVSTPNIREIFINDNGKFRPMRQGEHSNL